MPNYSMTQHELSKYIRQCLDDCQSLHSENIKDEYSKILSEVLATDASFESESDKNAISESLMLWNQQIKDTSQILIGKNYIIVSELFLEIIKMLAETGKILYSVVADSEHPDIPSLITSAIAVREMIIYIRKTKLKREEICLYLQTRTHNMHKEFTIDELCNWFPHPGSVTCNMHIKAKSWECKYCHSDDNDRCDIVTEGKEEIKKILSELYKKGVITTCGGKENKYKFR